MVERICVEVAAAGWADEDLFAFRMALAEGVMNAIMHGNRRDPMKRVTVIYRLSAKRIVATVEDEGRGFDSARIPNPVDSENLAKPTGRGLLLMRHYSDRLCFNRAGNRVTLGTVRRHRYSE
jgi:serine/threonine-protein kinase RsbW